MSDKDHDDSRDLGMCVVNMGRMSQTSFTLRHSNKYTFAAKRSLQSVSQTLVSFLLLIPARNRLIKQPEVAATASEAAVCYKLLTKTVSPQSVDHKHYHFHCVRCSFRVSPRKVEQFYFLILVHSIKFLFTLG